MVFSGLPFIFVFLPVFLLVYYIIPVRWRNLFIFLGSIVFYSMGALKQPLYIVLFLVSVFINYFLARLIGGLEDRFCRKVFLVGGLIFDFGWLFVFKYADFFFSLICKAINATGHAVTIEEAGLILPLGISFYTFQMVSYLVDVYKKDVEEEKSFINFGAYVTMFAQLIAGPIVTYPSMKKQLKRPHTFNVIMFSEGMRFFIIGLGLKVLLANQLGNLWNQLDFIGYDCISTKLAWLGIYAYSMQLYFDFWGYSLMAVGIGKMLGFELPRNFNNPYMSLSVTEFWRRWHITLGAWFRDYLYIPLGGSRNGKAKCIRNIFIVWVLTGLWHGAGLNFVLWGFMLFVLMLIEKLGLKKILDKIKALGHIYILFVIPITWAVFAITDFGQLSIFFQRMFPFLCKEEMIYFKGDFIKYLGQFKIVLAAGVLFVTPWPFRILLKIRNSYVGMIIYIAIFWASIYCLYIGMNDPFMYFRF